MVGSEERYIVDSEGNRIAVILDLATYERLIDAVEELEDIRDGMAVLEALAKGDEEAVPIEQAIEAYEARQASLMQPTS